MESQHGFVKGRTYQSNLITLFEKVTRCTDEGRAIGVIYVHTSTAFDKLPRGKLIEKRKAGRIQGDLANWIQN